MMIVFLPPNFTNDINDDSNTIDHASLSSYTPNVTITRIHKSKDNSLLVYQIEQISESYSSSCSFTQMTAAVSSQPNPSVIRRLYQELKYEIIADISGNTTHILPTQLLHIFGIVLDLQYDETATAFKCTTVLVFDFDINRSVCLKLWRGLAAWITSLTPGSRIQVRNLLLKNNNNELHSTSSTEIYLLAHGHTNNSSKLSARIDHLNQKERDILLFLNHQSLLLPKSHDNHLYSSILHLLFPFYLQFNCDRDNCWLLQGTDNDFGELVSVYFRHFDAKVWQCFNELFMEPSRDSKHHFELVLSNLKRTEFNNCFEFISSSTLQPLSSPPTSELAMSYMKLDWNDLISAKVALYGTFEIEGLLEQQQHQQSRNFSSEESLGNLSILPDEQRSQPPGLVLKCPTNPNWSVNIENHSYVSDTTSTFIVNIRTILNEGNVHEIIRKSIFIVNKAHF